MKRTAVLIDGGFFIQRIRFFSRKFLPEGFELTAAELRSVVETLVQKHIAYQEDMTVRELYRIYFYDCPPLDKQVKFPLPDKGQKTASTKNFRTHPPYRLRHELHEELRVSRKTALRLGELSKHGKWRLTDHCLAALLKGERAWENITNDDFFYDVDQKAVDLKLGMDITTLTLNKLVDVIVLIAGDSDFVPAAKLARTNGIDFVLDPMWANPSSSLREHVDGIRSFDMVRMISDASGVDVRIEPDWWPETADGAPMPAAANTFLQEVET
ncbi:NYN domain-containing protein [Pseudomonas sp.]|uniref:NYN domain-containing protein n=1 Tax=Pseudomonas sp. TaxID=306 RepID=UPI002583BC0A|nr:NYN domain-containing protein [Pseudomonas sp.]